MELLAYDEFSAIDPRELLPAGANVREGAAGGEHTVLGFNRCRRILAFGSTYFCYTKKAPKKLSAVDVDLDGTLLTADAADAVLRALRLPVGSSGDVTVEQLLSTFGKPDHASKENDRGVRVVRFAVGSRWPYAVGFHVRSAGGLARFWVARKDHVRWDEE